MKNYISLISDNQQKYFTSFLWNANEIDSKTAILNNLEKQVQKLLIKIIYNNDIKRWKVISKKLTLFNSQF